MIHIETCCEYTSDIMYVSSDQKRIINRIRKYKEQYPDAVRIIRDPEQNDGCIYATVPAEWLKIAPPRAINMTDERKAELAERLKTYRESKDDSANVQNSHTTWENPMQILFEAHNTINSP